ncbi:MAG: tRNA threonylcarbamoyladenosine dehydratase [Eubacterium sp.]|nr:tRNA threonylcarbamoyladenosine dehydratase [Eubacterium sp.]
MENQFLRTELLFGNEAMKKLSQSRVAVFGIGGVGSYVTEALVRSGIGEIDIIDNDTVSLTNLNRQLIALYSTVGKSKTEVMKARILDINPDCKVNAFELFFNEETAGEFDFSSYDYVVDAIDSVKSKLLIAEICNEKGVRLISSMGTGNKLDPQGFEICDIKDTSYDPLARVMRKELSKRGIYNLTVVYSKEQAQKIDEERIKELLKKEDSPKRTLPASNAFVPASAGLVIASKVIKDLIGK